MPTTSTAYNTIVRITETIDGNGWEGTGVLLSPDEVLTANHLAYKNGNGGHVATDIQVVPGYQDGAAPFGTYTGTVAHYAEVTNEPIISFADMQTDYAIIHLSTPVIGGSIAKLGQDFDKGEVHITGYPLSAEGSLVDSIQTVSTDPNYSLYESTPLGAGSSGSPLWYASPDGTPNVVGLVSAVNGDTAYDLKLTAAKTAQINAWVKADDATLPPVTTTPVAANPVPVTPVVTPPVTPDPVTPSTPPAVTDPAPIAPVVTPPIAPQPTTPVVTPPVAQPPAFWQDVRDTMLSIADGKTGQTIADVFSKPYLGPVANIFDEYVNITTQNLNIAARLANAFIHTGSGNDAIAAHSGTNVLDGGTGSNFLCGGSGADTFFVDVRNAAADVWSTFSKMHSGDAATVWGVSAASWSDNGGTAGYQGLTMHAKGANGVNASLTIAGMSSTDMAAGKVSASFGHDSASGSDYLYVKVT